eukprot:CAMPEP_0114331058 /NCGR_PEP_ID=MMETSP0101-20121206/2159_1 /TAXON_ID=38822 ORGANISM="Pteridomonas danica, Strain PT" /NCGR_SAMPLE_ID=MMETSP0101 /ASSEMBLY_ACC=CAM_ASM_000211 /LENGTH=320 /DNA_ID=CAMNT_0001461265 /DNA_START=99 /DNA_END=1061 /DNA_ORIENTATION=+
MDLEQLKEWLTTTVESIAGLTSIDPHQPFDVYGVDSLAQINLARRISLRTGLATFGVGDLMRNPTISSTIEHIRKTLNVAPFQEVSQNEPAEETPHVPVNAASPQRVLCFHGFRSSGELIEVALSSFFRSSPSKPWSDLVELEFVTAPHPSSGPTDPTIPEGVPTYEWWCGEDKTYEEGWTVLGDIGPTGKLETSRQHILKKVKQQIAPVVGLIGFSQGGALACYLAAKKDFPHLKWIACFSAVPPKNVYEKINAPPLLQKLMYRSFHCFDESEDHPDLCSEVIDMYQPGAKVVHHSDGHAIPKNSEISELFFEFLSSAD